MLEHISVWDEKHGWVHTTAIEAQLKFPQGKISSKHKKYLCESCEKYVGLEKKKNGPYFRHSGKTGYCKDKTNSEHQSYLKKNPLGFSLPLRIEIRESNIEIFVGFLPLDSDMMGIAERKNEKLIIKPKNSSNIKQYNITTERFSEDHITYLSVGTDIAEKYELNYNSDLKYYWPKIVEGVVNGGTLFDYLSHKRLPRGANTFVGRRYLLLTKKSEFHVKSYGIEVVQEKTIGEWNLYSIIATVLSKGTAEYFFRYKARLTDEPAKITHIWPPSIRSSHFLIYSSGSLWFHKSKGYVDIYPLEKSYGQEKSFFCVERKKDLQILSLSKFEDHENVLKYTFARYTQRLNIKENKISPITVKDTDGNIIKSGDYAKLPKKRQLCILPEFDGFISVYEGEYESDRIPLKGGIECSADVNYGKSLRFYQGLDCIYEISFMRESSGNIGEDDRHLAGILAKCSGNEAKISHEMGAVAHKMKNMPLTKIWLKKQIDNGKMSRKAMLILAKRFGRVS